MFVVQPKPWQILSLILLVLPIILFYSHKRIRFLHAPFMSLRMEEVDGSHKSSRDQWWADRFSEKEEAEMSQVGKWLFLSEPYPPQRKSSFLILMWRYGETTSRRYMRAYQKSSRDPYEICSVSNCNITYNEGDILQAHAVVFHLHKLKTKDLDDILVLPRHPSQRWVFITDESPHHTNLFHPKLNGLFNWSMTYHSSSDVPVPYGRVVLAQEEEIKTFSLDRNFHGEKNQTVAILASNCGGKSGRYRYFDSLLKHLQVDVFGGCSKKYNMSLGMACPGHFTADCPGIEKYKFYLAFENSLCSEYITEKLWWNAYEKRAVPIVLGGLSKQDYAKLAPPDSFIHVDDFNSTFHLAQYVKHLITHQEEYNKYHTWRQQYIVLNEHGYFGAPILHYCRLCEALNFNSNEKKIYQELGEFWNQQTQCRNKSY